jgi:phage shock protein A
MYKTLVTIVRGASALAGQEFADRNALLILDQQIRDATNSLERGKKALALAIAHDRQEGARVAAAETQIADLEARVTAALQAGAEALARDGAEAIVRLEADRNSYRAAKAFFEPEIQRQCEYVAQAQRRLLNVERGRRVARAGESIRLMRRGGVEEGGPHRATLADAEATLSRLRDRQTEIRVADEALDELEIASSPETIAKKLAAEGFGPRVAATADDILSHLRARVQTEASTDASPQS